MQTFKEWLDEEKQRLDPKCWDGYKKKGTKMKGDTRVNNCVKEEELQEIKQSDINQAKKRLEFAKAMRKKAQENEKERAAVKSSYGIKPLPRSTQSVQTEAKGMEGMTQGGGHKRPTDQGAGLTKKGVEKYRRQNPGSKLQTAVTTPPSKLKPDSKAAKRRKSFCARSRSWTGERGKAARRRWNC